MTGILGGVDRSNPYKLQTFDKCFSRLTDFHSKSDYSNYKKNHKKHIIKKGRSSGRVV